MPDASPSLWVWRHPRPHDAAGRCIGRSDVGVDRRRAKRLAHRIRQVARRHGLPRHVLTSPLRRCAAVGRGLRHWDWRNETLPALREMDFGRWDGIAWTQIAREEVDAWCADFLCHRLGDGENLRGLFERVAAWRAAGLPAVIVSHGGWMLARQWLSSGRAAPVRAEAWPAPPRYGACWVLPGTLAPVGAGAAMGGTP